MPTHSILTPRLAARIVTRVARGVPIETVASQLRITDRSIYRWLQEPSDDEAPRPPLHFRLRQAVARANAHWEWHQLRELDLIARAAPGDKHVRTADRVKVLTWGLERRPQTRKRYGLQVDINHHTRPDPSLQALERKPTPDVLELADDAFRQLLPPDET